MKRYILIASLMALSLAIVGEAGFRNRNFAPDGVGADGRQAVETAMKGYAEALQKGTPETVAGCYTTDGQLQLPGTAALKGREAIRAFLAPLVASFEVAAVDIDTEFIDVHDNTADHWGTYRQTAGERGKAKQTFQGRYAAIWHLGKDGHWRLFRLMMQPL
jgi:uncharacterized protein (TIGR02246 family)